jgi:hypothetical protein
VPELITRRSLLLGLGALLAAPAIVRASSLMPVKAWVAPPKPIFAGEIGSWQGIRMLDQSMIEEAVRMAQTYGVAPFKMDGEARYTILMPSSLMAELRKWPS